MKVTGDVISGTKEAVKNPSDSLEIVTEETVQALKKVLWREYEFYRFCVQRFEAQAKILLS